MTDIPEGYVLISNGRSRQKAAAAIAAAAEAGHPSSSVKAVAEGYLVPAGAEDGYTDTSTAPSDVVPDESWKNGDIRTWADAHGVDLGDATKKADMLAVIAVAKDRED